MTMNKINTLGIIPSSFIDGEGIRYTIYFQGCKHKCTGCHNPDSWNFKINKVYTINQILKDIEKRKNFIDGISISGGDAFFQPHALLELVKTLKKNKWNIWIWTGFTIEELENDEKSKQILKYIDVVIDGKYEQNETSNKPYRGSDNQRMWIKKGKNFFLKD